jgi:hypothetical protein
VGGSDPVEAATRAGRPEAGALRCSGLTGPTGGAYRTTLDDSTDSTDAPGSGTEVSQSRVRRHAVP